MGHRDDYNDKHYPKEDSQAERRCPAKRDYFVVIRPCKNPDTWPLSTIVRMVDYLKAVRS